MNLKTYFEDTEGTGVLATADSNGKVDTAIYARPHFMEDNIGQYLRTAVEIAVLDESVLRSSEQTVVLEDAFLFLRPVP